MQKANIFVLIAGLVFFTIIHSEAQTNVSMVGQLSYPTEFSISDVWGYDDGVGNSYALVGRRTGLSVVDVSSDPSAPVEVAYVNGPSSLWYDIKVWGDHAYTIHDATDPGSSIGFGLLITDLSNLPAVDTVTIRDFGSGVSFQHAHNVFIDENGFLYIVGANYGVGGAIILDLNGDPENPALVGVYDDAYVHDIFVRGDTMWTAEIYQGHFGIFDVSDKANPVSLGSQNSPDFFTHNVWLSDDGQTLFTTDEVSGGHLGAYDVSDVNDINELDRYSTWTGEDVIPHNAFVYGNHLITSYYTDGVVIHDVSDPSNMIEVGRYDTSPLTGTGYGGCWGVYPYSNSGYVYATDGQTGLSVLQVTWADASGLTGTITNSATTAPLNNVVVSIEAALEPLSSDAFGNYKGGTHLEGTYNVTYSKFGYESKTVALSFTSGATTVHNESLDPLPSFTLSGQVVDAVSGDGIPKAQIKYLQGEVSVELETDLLGNFTIDTFFEGSWTVFVGKWSYLMHYDESTLIDAAAASPVYSLDAGLEDDFELDLGWLSVGTSGVGGSWELGEPIGTDFGLGLPYPANPEEDLQDDIGTSCYVTGNSGIYDFVNDGSVTLLSPQFDATAFSDPVIEISSRIVSISAVGIANDVAYIRLSDGSTTIDLDTISMQSFLEAPWVNHEYRIADYTTPTNAMKLIVLASADLNFEEAMEVAVDGFAVREMEVPSGIDVVEESILTVYPNPATSRAYISLPTTISLDGAQFDLRIYDATGRLVNVQSTVAGGGRIAFTTDALGAGLYFFDLLPGGSGSPEQHQLIGLVRGGKFNVYR